VRHAPRTRVPADNRAGDAETSTASPATPRRLCRTNAALLQPYSAVSPPTSPAAAAAAAATGTTSPPPTAYWQWAWHLPQTSPVSTRGDEEDDLDDDGVTFDDAVQALLTASELVARAASQNNRMQTILANVRENRLSPTFTGCRQCLYRLVELI